MSYTTSRIFSTLVLIVALLVSGIPPRADTPAAQVLFVCEHGNVKSLMAASYFNRFAEQRKLPFRAIARGTAPDSTSVPAPIITSLRAEGFDVSAFHPAAVSAAELGASRRVVTISTTLPAREAAAASSVESWNDVPAASVNYEAASESLRTHVETLLALLSKP